jgi:hydroxymethylglutaryl-CoA reductase
VNNIDWNKFDKFYKKPIEERRAIVQELFGEIDFSTLDIETADRMSENVISIQGLPFSLAPYFRINGKDYLVPMAVEESSVVAAASFGAKLTLPEGFKAKADDPIMTGEIFIKTPEPTKTAELIEKNKEKLEEIAKASCASMEKRGGGFRGYRMEKKQNAIILFFDVDVRDAMGANTINSVGEEIKKGLIALGIRPTGVILTNLCLKRMVEAEARWEINERIAPERFIEMYEWAEQDVFRAVTNNKGIMNGIDAVAIATGNDWRAIESACHCYASLDGGYKPLATWKIEDEHLHGKIKLPLAVGIVGGATKVNPLARVALKILGVESAQELAMVMACVGLANNFAAIRAISKEGIQRGHMRLHAVNLAMMAGAKGKEVEMVRDELIKSGKITMENAKLILEKIRGMG